MQEINVNFLFSALTFISILFPLLIEIKNNYPNLKPRFFIRSNRKGYVNPIKNKKVYQELFKKYQILIFPGSKLRNYPGINFCVDGDTYGPTQSSWNQSLLLAINRKNYLSLSFIENLNFKWSYNFYHNLVDFTILPNKIWSQTYKLNGKNLYLGNPKYDLNFNRDSIYQKHQLDPQKKYVVFFYPRFERGVKKFGKNFPKYYQNLMIWFEDLDYIILTKNRKKIKYKSATQATRPYFVDTDYFPHISMELLEICDLAVFFGSSVIEEIVMAEKPFVEFLFDDTNRLSFLRDSSYSLTYSTLPNESQIKKQVREILNHQPKKFKEIKEKYLFNPNQGSQRIIDRAIDLYQKEKMIK